MSKQNAGTSTASQTEGQQTDTSTGQQTEGQQQQTQSQTSSDNKQTEGSKVSFTPEQQAFINSLIKSESEKAVNKAQKKWQDDAKLSEDEKLKKELADAKAALQERDNRDFVASKAKTAGVNNPNLFYEANKARFERNDKGEITNFDEVLTSSKTEFPELFTVAGQGVSMDAGKGKDSQPAITKEQIAQMSPDEINKNWDEISKVLSQK